MNAAKTNVKGLGIRSGSWHLRRMVKGRLINKALGRTDVVTQDEAERIAIEVLNGKSVMAAKAPSITLGEVSKDYLGSPKGMGFKESYRKSIERFIERDLVVFKDRPVSQIDKSEVLAWYKRGSNKPTATDNAFRVLHTLFEYAMALEYIKANPCKIVNNTGRYRKRRRKGHLSPESTEIGEFAWAIINYEPPQDKRNFHTSRDASPLAPCDEEY
jgi:hypothetical protein